MKRFTLTQLLLFMTWCGIACFVASQYLTTRAYRGRLNSNHGTTFFHYAEGRRFASSLGDEALRKTTPWVLRNADPPLSARAALAIAEKLRQERLRDVKNWEWGLESITLLPLDGPNHKWCWQVNFAASPKSDGASHQPHFSAFVLMNGEVITPEEQVDGQQQYGILPLEPTDAEAK